MQSYMRLIALSLGLAIALGLGLFAFAEGGTRYSLLTLNNEPFVLEVAETPALRTRGLRGRSSLADDGGMEIRLDKPAVLSYSTRYTPFPIDVVYFDNEGQVVTIDCLKANDTRLPASTSPQPVMGALLLPGGTTQRLVIRPGYVIPFGRKPRRIEHDPQFQ